jgi:Rab3 GTPase-activating protein catalytic subunit
MNVGFRSDLQEEILTDNEVHSDLDPLEAPTWSVRAQFEDTPTCLMSRVSQDA